MALAGLLLAVLVWLAWPEAATPMEPAAEPTAGLVQPAGWEGPPPLPSAAELQPDYVAESPEELGAEPLPGAELTPVPPPVAN